MVKVDIKKDYIKPSKWSRPQRKLNSVKGLVIHWVANPMSSAQANRNFFNNRTGSYGSAHYVVGLRGEIIQALPDDEMGYHVGSSVYTSSALKKLGSYPNNASIGIEMTHEKWDGKPNKETYESTIALSAKILKEHNLDENDLWLHKTVVGWKNCSRWYVNNNNEWKKFKEDVGKLLKGEANLNPEVDTDDMILVEADAKGYYEVKNGDTLWSISQALDVDLPTIEKLNPSVNPKTLKVGQKIKVKEVNIGQHKVKKGDTLWGIANKYETTVDKLRQLNSGVEAKTLQVGATIVVPNGEESSSKPTKTNSHTHKYDKVGRVKGDVWIHSKPDFKTSTRTKIAHSGDRVEVCCDENGLYNTNVGYISKKYVEIVNKKNVYDLPRVVLKLGDRGSNVVKVQRALNKLNFKVGAEDGIFGSRTGNALKRFQSMYASLKVDGIYGKNTELEMEKQLNK